MFSSRRPRIFCATDDGLTFLQRLKPIVLWDLFGTTEVAPCYKAADSASWFPSFRKDRGRMGHPALKKSELALQEFMLPALKHHLIWIIPIEDLKYPADD